MFTIMKEYLLNLIQYDTWANKEISDCLIKLEEPPEKSLSLMSHIINARIIWLNRLKSLSTDISVWQLYAKSELDRVLEKSSGDLYEFLNSVPEKDLQSEIVYTNTKGESFRSSINEILTHLIIHSAYHRGQIISDLKQIMKTLPFTDYIYFVRSIKK